MPPVSIAEVGDTMVDKNDEDSLLSQLEGIRDAGNAAFKTGDLQAALTYYTKGIALQKVAIFKTLESETCESGAQLADGNKLIAIMHRNRAFVKLKSGDAKGCEDDCTAALDFDRADVKALYRRSLAREQLGSVAEAFYDAKAALRLEPKDKAITELLQRLVKANQQKQENALSMDSRFKDMDKLAFGDSDENKIKALNNLLVLARESETGSDRVWSNGDIVQKLLPVIKDKEKTADDLAITAIRIIDELAKCHKKARQMWITLSMRELCRLMCVRPSQQYIDASGLIIQRVFNALAKMDRTKGVKPDAEISEANKVEIIRLILELEEMLTDKEVTALVRNTVLDLFTKNLMHMDGGLPRGWSWKFTEDRGLWKLLIVASQVPEQMQFPVDAETRQHVAVCLARLYDDMVFDTRRTVYTDRVKTFFDEKISACSDGAIRVEICALLTTLLQGAVDVGMNLVTNDQVTAMMLEMAASDNVMHQSVAAELIVQTVSKRERATTVLNYGVQILKKLYDSKNEDVKVRALMGLCKCAAAGGDDASIQTMQEGSTIKLAQTCKRFLLAADPRTKQSYSVNIRRFACEGLAYLSLDADVKEFIVDEDPQLIRSLVDLAKSAGALCVYAVASIFVNATNTYDKPKHNEEMVKLAQFAKHHVPETHPKDTEEYVEKRVRSLVQEGAVSACIAVSKTESKNCLELLSRCMVAFCTPEELRGRVVKEGGAKLLLTLLKTAGGQGQLKAAEGLAKLGVKSDPTIVFPGQRAYEVVKPMLDLLHPEVEGFSNYEALLTLTNLGSVSDSIRKRILKEGGVPKIEEFWFMTEHENLRAAAAECLMNLLHCEEFVEKTLKPGTDRLKVWVLYAGEDDERLAMSASAAFAILSQYPEGNRRILEELKSWPEHFKELAMCEWPEVQRRCIMAIANMVESDERICAEIMQTEMFRVLVAVSKLNNDERKGAIQEAQRALDAAEKLGFIAATEREKHEREHNVSTITEE